MFKWQPSFPGWHLGQRPGLHPNTMEQIQFFPRFQENQVHKAELNLISLAGLAHTQRDAGSPLPLPPLPLPHLDAQYDGGDHIQLRKIFQPQFALPCFDGLIERLSHTLHPILVTPTST
jgi:hypothetical protein